MKFLGRLLKRPSKKMIYRPSSKLMDEHLFWEIIDTSYKQAQGDFQEQVLTLEEDLKAYTLQQIIEFDNRFRYFIDQAEDWKLWGAIYLIQGGCSDDSFMDFRGWLIAQGKNTFYNALEDPETLVDYDEDQILVQWEGFAYVAPSLFQKLTKKEIPSTYASEGDITGEEWEDKDLKDLFPILFVKYPDNV